MWRPAVSRFGVAGLVAFLGCWSGSGKSDTTPSNNELDPAPQSIAGSYWCSIDSDGYEYPRYACVIKKVGQGLMLAKLGGSQRIRGNIALDKSDGFTFNGELFCPWGDCNQSLHGRFRPIGKGGFKGTFREDSIVIRLTPADVTAFGGEGYGGDEYGVGFGYGGAGYGGYGYGGYRPTKHIDSRGRRRP